MPNAEWQMPNAKCQIAKSDGQPLTPGIEAPRNNPDIEPRAPASSVLSLAKQKRRYPSLCAPKSTPGTHPIRPSGIRYSVIDHASDSTRFPAGGTQVGFTR